MEQWVAGVDIGTSSVKVLCINKKGQTIRSRCRYNENGEECIGPAAWWSAIQTAFSEIGKRMDTTQVIAIGLDGQVGTYILWNSMRSDEEQTVIGWRDGRGKEQLIHLKQELSDSFFRQHISMPHPNLISYPAPRIRLFQKEMEKEWEMAEKILQPKDHSYMKLTGLCVSDPYSWRGLANLNDGNFHTEMLEKINVKHNKLPLLYCPHEAPGKLLPCPAKQLGLTAGISVFIGCNDFFAGLLGMGMLESGQCFDITGTSEHLGIVTDTLPDDVSLISGPYLRHFVHYGVTACSGSSMSWGLEHFKNADWKTIGESQSLQSEKPPLFLPYLDGERMPICNPLARGVFFGLHVTHRPEHMLYAVMEGVTFSLYHIAKYLPMSEVKAICTAGGAAGDDVLNQLKADLFQLPVRVLKEQDSSALGAAIFAAVGVGWFETMQDAVKQWVKVDRILMPCAKRREKLLQRFEIYRSLYPIIEDTFEAWNEI